MRRRNLWPLWVALIVTAGLIFFAVAQLVGQREPTVTLTEVPSPVVLPSPTTVVIWHLDPDGKVRWGRLATCRGQVCLPGPTVTP